MYADVFLLCNCSDAPFFWQMLPHRRPYYSTTHPHSRPANMQTASLALEASRASQLQCVHSELRRFWHRAAEISGKVWALLGGPMADNRARRLTQALQPLQAPGCREMDADERLELETLLLELVCSFAAAEMVTAVAESLLNRLPNNKALVASMIECLLCASTRPPAVCSSLGMWRKWQLHCGRLGCSSLESPDQLNSYGCSAKWQETSAGLFHLLW
jgi:hypothetical protein